MPKVRMRDTTAHADYGSMLAGEVYEVSAEHAEHFANVARVAKPVHGNTQTYHDKMGIQPQQAADEDEDAPMNPDIARQVAEAGTKEGDTA